ncbi:isochorismate synthase [Bacteroidota bacterium]
MKSVIPDFNTSPYFFAFCIILHQTKARVVYYMQTTSDQMKSGLEQAILNGHSFVAWRSPKSSAINMISGQKQLISISELSSHSFVIAPFDYSGKVFSIKKSNTPEILSNPASVAKYYTKNQGTTETKDKSTFSSLITKGIDLIKTGQLEKVVLSRKAGTPLPDSFCPVEFFKQLTHPYPNAFISLISTPEEGTWIGASPELLVKQKEDEIESISLAGTISSENFFNGESISKKDSMEQEIVSRYIREQLIELNIPFSESEPQLINAGKINHIKTSFKGNLNGNSVADLINQLHPTPAICGYPKQEASHFIKQHEGYSRSLYGGFIGPYTHEKEAEFYVNLRCMQVTEEEIIFYAGAGILKDSIPQNEWEETEFKMDTLRTLLVKS